METCIHTPIGWLLIDYEDEVIERIRFSDTPADCVEANTKVIHELRAYFTGKLIQFTVKPKLPTNSLHKKVYEVLLHIPYGKTCSYSEVAQLVGSTPRGVARIIACNPIPIIIPCHRVIYKTGDIGGYSGGVWRKRFLLELESTTLNLPYRR
ncbi:methylated-DNA--[protein]-cysteine S-methyltransferase [candidate division WOR-3 bacterium]|nr:methylated-DNA--[protein]-cysteine S-methyltransferase [candidate division WOR-3 bacterium]